MSWGCHLSVFEVEQQGGPANFSRRQEGSMGERKEPQDYHRMASLRNARWLGPHARNANTHTTWQCQRCGTEWRAIYNSLQRGTACPVCGIRKRSRSLAKRPEDYHSLASARGFEWLGPGVERSNEKTRWRCASDHVWPACYGKIMSGRGCPICARAATAERSRQQRHPPLLYHALAQRLGFRWLGSEVSSANCKTTWECRQAAHRWQSTYNKINHGRGCPRCATRSRADSHRHTSADYHALAHQRGFTWIGPAVLTVARKSWWRCLRGHSWRATYNSIQQGSGCHVCQDRVNGRLVSRIQRRLCRRLRGQLNKRVGNYAIDVALEIDGVQIAVEYDSWYYHGGQEILDQVRDHALMETGWRVLRIRSPGPLPPKRDLDAALQRILGGEQRVILTLPGWGEGPTLRRKPGRE